MGVISPNKTSYFSCLDSPTSGREDVVDKRTSKHFLTKSKFSEAWTCPRRLNYLNNKLYGNNKSDDSFLKALAEGGFQVGALAQAYHQGGILVNTLDKDEAIGQTAELLRRDEVTIFEGAFCFENLFIRADIVRKKGKFIELVEVKAKSFDSTEEFQVWHKVKIKKGEYQLAGDFQSYIMDLAFQTHVVQKARPDLTVRSFLLLADKSKLASVDGLNQFFKISYINGRTSVVPKPGLVLENLGDMVLSTKELTEEIRQIFDKVKFDYGPSFAELVSHLAKLALTGDLGEAAHGAQCKTCPFRVTATKEVRSGFDQCWTEKGLKPAELSGRPMIFEVWDFRSSEKMIEEGIYFADQLDDEIVKLKGREDDRVGLSRTERQMLQIDFYRGLRKGPFVDFESLKQEMREFNYPLHFIDFETNRAAIPFHKALRPYEQIAFQFSHHLLHEDGRLEHKTEHLDDRIGVFPNFDFVRALKRALGNDDGTILRFAAHENTVLNEIREQLLLSSEADAEELVAWIESLTTPPTEMKGAWTPTRQFVDMCEMTKRLFWLPEMGGSNSIKRVLPAVLNAAGARLKLKFPDWIHFDSRTGRVMDPYKLLPPILADVDPVELEKISELLVNSEELADGGAAMIAWARMQFTEMSEIERNALRQSLLRYCRLDTLAMVMIWEWWSLLTKDSNAGQSTKASSNVG